ncbi:Hypothetical protein DIP0334 [Corynebacterium diphtheriae]|uniref:Uncharacterized protein n=1 Tax=Corynebacterium diphtheriae (strain ATCC 700971 / NCTC 13129 / Biotype gravis) TaxID=257309 RepID=Q6NJQ9_CORDI|nr:hypothetical protein BUE68_07300 [Corynebacterium diphtheriae]OMO46929.1 hypothetical protein BVL37_04425 [Corynebacterium diphtheriae]OMO48795.1 hypothetical protein BVL40_02950 [Corynebacterium diphtheriae]OWM45566.1 hypothetical protein BU160_09070 [Corynebacterium diphtheriae]OWM46276.1 hypothetical protein BU161_10250 [Corynebacterium diphtheriae]
MIEMLLYEDTRMRAVEILRSLPIGNSGVSGLVQLAATLGASVEFRPSIPPFPESLSKKMNKTQKYTSTQMSQKFDNASHSPTK